MKITALDLYGFGMIDEIVPEENPAHERPREVIAAAGSAIRRHLGDLHAPGPAGKRSRRARPAPLREIPPHRRLDGIG